jgi:hypothetical protein
VTSMEPIPETVEAVNELDPSADDGACLPLSADKRHRFHNHRRVSVSESPGERGRVAPRRWCNEQRCPL